MTEATDPGEGEGEATFFPKSVGERLRDARLAQKLELADIAQRTRVPLRHLTAIENNDYSSMPTPTYAVGFARAYARAVGEDEVAIARDVRGKSEIAVSQRPEFAPYETDDTPRTPSRGVLIGGIVVAALILLAAVLYFGTGLFRGDGSSQPAPAATESYLPEAAPSVAAPAAPATGGQVTLVATDAVWVRIYDAAGTTLMEKTLQAGDRYDVPGDANNPMINIGRADKLQVLVNGAAVAPLGDGKRPIKDVGVSAAALQARAQGASPAPASSAVPAAVSSAPATAPSARATVPAAFRTPAPQPTRRSAAPASTGQRDVPPAAATPNAAAPGNATGTR